MTYDRIIDDCSQDSLSQIAKLIPAGSRVLDLGAASGALGRYLSSRKNCTVDGVEYDPTRAAAAERWYRDLRVGDLESMILADHFSKNGYDVIVCADVLEHLRSPGFLLGQFQQMLADGGRVLMSVPNVAYAGVISSLLLGEFAYDATGILDSTHVRFFTRKSLLRTLREHGLHVSNLKAVVKDPRDSEFRKYFPDVLPPSIFRALAAQPDALTYQFIVEAVFQEQDAGLPDASAVFPVFGCQLFWRFEGEEYATQQSVIGTGIIGVERQTISLELPPTTKPFHTLRLDPADRPGFLQVYGMRLLDREGGEVWSWAGDLAGLARMAHRDIVFFPANAKGSMLLTGDDPHVELPVGPEALAKLTSGGKLEIEVGWPLSADFLAMLDRLDKKKYLRENKLLRSELEQLSKVSEEGGVALRADNLHLRLENHDVRDELRNAKDSIAHLQGQLDQAFMAISNLETARRAMRASFSWRLTAPLRGLGWLLRVLRRVLVETLHQVVALYRKHQNITLPGGMGGHLDFPHPDSTSELDSLAVAGWLFSKHSPIVSMSVTLDGNNEAPLTYGYERPDVALANPDCSSAGKSGFGGVCSLKHEKQGARLLEIWATLQNGDRVKCFSRTVKVRALAVPTISFLATVRFFYGAYKKAWRAFREGRLPMSPAAWLLGLRRYRMAIRAHGVSEPGGSATVNRNIVLDAYQQWIETNRLTPKLVTRMKADAQRMASAGGAKISLIVPVYNPSRQFLGEMIESVVSQIYPNWELCLADDASTQPHVREMLEAAVSSDSRIKVEFRPENGHIVKATNTALAMASGQYVALLDHDDMLPQDALLHVAECIARHPDVDWMYTDEDKIDAAGYRFDPQFKGAWNPEMAITHNFTHHLTVIRRSLMERVGGMREGFEGAQDLDLFLRVAENTEQARIRHIPHICYHWRSHSESTASQGTQKNYVFDSAYRAIGNALVRRGLNAEPFLPPFAAKHGLCLHQLRWKDSLGPSREVTIVIPTRDQPDLLKRCVSSLQKTVDSRFVKLLLIDDRTTDERALAFLNELESEGALQCKVVRPNRGDGQFNYARLINEAAEYVDTPYMLQLNNDIEAIEPGWLEELMGWMSIKGVGVAGGRLLYPDQTIQHAGVVIGPHGGLADHQFHLLPREEVGYLALPHAARNVSAVTGACLLTETNLFRELGGFDEVNFAVEYNDVDYCLRVGQAGRRVVYTPQATLLHVTSASRGRDYNPAEHVHFVQKYKGMRDPYMSEELRLDSMMMAVEGGHFSYGDRIKRLNVLVVSHNLTLSGAPIVAFELAKYFSKVANYQVAVISPQDGPVRERYEALGIPVRILADFPDLHHKTASEARLYLSSLGRSLDMATMDLVVCNTLTAFWGVDMASMFGISSVWHIHESVSPQNYGDLFSEPSMRDMLRSAFHNAGRVVFQAEATRRIYQPLDVNRNFSTIPGGLPLALIEEYRNTHGKKELRDKYQIARDATVVTLVGTTCERKGQHVFLESIKELGSKYPRGIPEKVIFLIVGAIQGPYLDMLNKTIARHGLKNVRIYGETKEIYDFYGLSDIFVCASFEESFPMVVLLAMAFELKIVSTDVFGIPEILSDGHEGVLVKAGDAKSMAAALYQYFEDSDGAARMAKRGYAKVLRLFDNRELLLKHVALTKALATGERALH